MNTKELVKYSMIAALYTVCSLILGNFAFGQIQFRYAEILSVLALRDKRYTYALTLGCFLTNLLGYLMGANPLVLDVFLGTFATFISCYMMWQLRNILWFDKPYLSLIVPAIINGIIIGAELAFYFTPDHLFTGFLINGTYVFISEFIIVTIFGGLVYKTLFKMLDNAKI